MYIYQGKIILAKFSLSFIFEENDEMVELKNGKQTQFKTKC